MVNRLSAYLSFCQSVYLCRTCKFNSKFSLTTIFFSVMI